MSQAELTPQDIIDRIPEAFRPERAEGLDAVFQFDISGPKGGRWHASIKDAKCQVESGEAARADLHVSISDENFVRLITGQLDGTMAFMTGKLKIKGDMALAMRLSGLFRLPG